MAKGRQSRGLSKSQQKHVTNLVNKQIAKKTEVKAHQQHLSTGVNTSPIAYNPLDYIVEGDSDENRNGNMINMLSFRLRSFWTNGDSPYNLVRCAFVSTRAPLPELTLIDSYYNAEELFKDLSTGRINAELDFDVVSKVHYDRIMTLNEFVEDEVIAKIFNKYTKFGKLGKKCYYNGDITSTLGSTTKTYMYLVLLSDSTIIPHPQINANWTVRYTDS